MENATKMLTTTTITSTQCTPLLHMVNHHEHGVAPLENFKAKVWGESWENILTLRSKANKDYYCFNFFSSPRNKPVIDCNLKFNSTINHNHLQSNYNHHPPWLWLCEQPFSLFRNSSCTFHLISKIHKRNQREKENSRDKHEYKCEANPNLCISTYCV